jgi:hypothetical protein
MARLATGFDRPPLMLVARKNLPPDRIAIHRLAATIRHRPAIGLHRRVSPALVQEFKQKPAHLLRLLLMRPMTGAVHHVDAFE